jgi:hypothetical protein
MFIASDRLPLTPNPVRGDISLLTELNRGWGRTDYKHLAPLGPLTDSSGAHDR